MIYQEKRDLLREHITKEMVDLEKRIEEFSEVNDTHDEASSGSLQQAKTRLTFLSAKLNTLDSDHFDECESCGEEIPLARLIAVPSTRLCVGCAE